MNLLAMSLVSAAALSFSSCSSNDDLTSGGAGTQSQVKGFYMTLAVQTPTSNGTRTSIENPIPTEDATAAEAAVKNGTFYLVDANGAVVFSKTLTGQDWTGAIKDQTGSQKDGKTTLQIQVENVAAGATYKVYFKAGSTNMDTVEPFTITTGTSKTGVFTATGITQTFTSTGAFAKPCDTDNNFSMFNQNDATTDGNGYTVTFTDANKVEATPAKVMYNNTEKAIKIERVTARVNVPTSTEVLLGEYPANASQALKNAIDDAKKKVTKIELVRYALSNITKKAYVMQNWNVANSVWSLAIPTDATLAQTKDAFGEKYLLKDDGFKDLKGATNDYIFENNKEDDATAMYFEYKVTLDANQFKNAAGELMPADCPDGTFYRYNNVIYTSFAQIMKAYEDVTGLFEGKTAAQLKTDLDEAKKKPTAATEKSVETKLAEFRAKYGIEVFNEGKTYYKQVIKDNQLDKNVIQRNTIYRLQVNKIFNVGAQVPNGEIDKNGLFYLDVTVTVNPWVLNTQGVELGD